MVKVSVIIPVYNTFPYLKQCLDSVVSQTLQEIEIICVNDGSTDGSAYLLEEYAKKDYRIKVIHKENGGVVSARKAGEAIARGKYIGFVDSDDWVDTIMYECLYTCAVNNKADLVTSGYYQEGDYTSVLYDGVTEGLYQGDAIQKLRDNVIYCMRQKTTGIRGSLCCKLFSQKLLIEHQIPVDINMSEDKLQVLTCVLDCQSVAVLKEAYYHYRINPKSATHTGNPSYLLCIDKVYRYFRRLYSHPNFTDEMKRQTELYIMELLIAGLNTRLGFGIRNLLWIDPYWLEQIPEGARIALYGGGEAAEKYKKQLLTKGKHSYAGCIDFVYDKDNNKILQGKFSLGLKSADYDCIVITIKNWAKASLIREQLVRMGVETQKILWFEQRELFWKYAEAEGLLPKED